MNPQTVEPIICTSNKSWRKTSEAGNMAIKPTQGLCFLLLLAYHSNIGFYSMSDQTDEIFLRYYYYRKYTFKTEQKNNSNEFNVLEVLYIVQWRSTRQMQLTNLTRSTTMYFAISDDGTWKSWNVFKVSIKA